MINGGPLELPIAVKAIRRTTWLAKDGKEIRITDGVRYYAIFTSAPPGTYGILESMEMLLHGESRPQLDNGKRWSVTEPGERLAYILKQCGYSETHIG